MNIAYLSNSPLDKMPANAVHVMSMCSAFSKHGHKVVLYARSDMPLDSKECFSIYGCDDNFEIRLSAALSFGRLSPVVYAFRQFMSFRRREGIDLYYARCALSALFALLIGRKVIFELHEVPHSFFLSFLYKVVLRFGRLLKVVVISDALKNDLLEAGFLNLDIHDICVAHDGANLIHDQVHASSIRKLQKTSRDRIVVGYAGGLRSGNGIELILRLAKKFPDIDFKIAGGASDEVARWKNVLNPTNVSWVGGLLPSEVPEFLVGCDILLAPYQDGPKTRGARDTSRWMSPLKIFEYMAAGKAILVSDYPVLREILNERTAILLGPGDFNSWVDALCKLSHHEQLRKSLGHEALKHLEAEYTWLKRAERVLEGVRF